ncbi:hypothetical protein B0H19DRAFT_1185614 [Mycena capillaripes]|nr:hypothetical protein B0H19DRAFT_1185614 [Mycena capillaripes]
MPRRSSLSSPTTSPITLLVSLVVHSAHCYGGCPFGNAPHASASRRSQYLPEDHCKSSGYSHLVKKHLCFSHGYSQQCQVLGQDPSSLPGAGGLSRLLESLPVFPMSSALTSSSPHIQISALAISETARVPAIGPAALTAALKEYEEGETTETDGENGNPSQSHPSTFFVETLSSDDIYDVDDLQ